MSDFDKCFCFCSGLNSNVNKALRDTNKDISNYDKLIEVAIIIDTHCHTENALYRTNWFKKPKNCQKTTTAITILTSTHYDLDAKVEKT